MNKPGKRLRVGVLFGGRSGEHEVSLISAASVIQALDPEKYEAVPIGISKDGRWFVGDTKLKLLPDILKKGKRVMLSTDPSVAALIPLGRKSRWRNSRGCDFPRACTERYGEDGTVQGLLELAGLPYVGAGVLGSAVGMDKDVQKRLFREAGLPVAEFEVIPRATWERSRADVLKSFEKKFTFPLFVKPAALGSSVGMTKVHDIKELPAALDLAAEFGQKIVVERGLDAREIELAVLGNDSPQASIPGEIVPHREFYDYAAKYLEDGTKLVIPAELSRYASQEIAGTCRARISGAGLRRNGANGFLPGTPHKQNLSERNQYDSRLHFHQHVSETLGSDGNSVPRIDPSPDPIGARSAPRKGAHQVFH